MSSSPTGTARKGVPPARHKAAAVRRWVRRLLRNGSLVVALILLLHTSPARRIVAVSATAFVGWALHGSVSVADLDYRLWAGDVRIEGLGLSRTGLALSCDQVSIHWGPMAGLQLRARHPRVVVALEPTAEASGPAGPSHPWAFLHRVADLVIERGALELRRQSDDSWLRLDGVDASLDRAAGRLRGAIQVGGVAADWPDLGMRIPSASARAELELSPGSQALRVVRAQLIAGGSRIEVAGQIEQLNPTVAQAQGRARMDERLLQALAPGLAAKGALGATASFACDEVGMAGRASLTARDLSLLGVGTWTGTARVRLDGRRLMVESIDLSGYGGKLSANGSSLGWDGPAGLDLRFRDIDVSALASSFTGQRLPSSSRAAGDLHLTLRDWDLRTLDGEGVVALRPSDAASLPVGGTLRLALDTRGLHLASADLRARGILLRAEGTLTLEKALAVRYSLRVPELARAFPLRGLRGSVWATGTIDGTLPSWRATARVGGGPLTIAGAHLALNGTVHAGPTGIDIEALALEGPDGAIRASGRIPLQKPGLWDLRGEVAGLRLAEILAGRDIPLAAIVEGHLQVVGPLDDPQGAVRFDAEVRSSMPDAETALAEPARLRASARVDRRRMVVEHAELEAGGGHAAAEGTWSVQGSTLEATLRAQGIAVERLPWRPAWLAALAATLSAEATVSGPVASPSGRAHVGLTRAVYGGRSLPDLVLEAAGDGDKATLSGDANGEPLLSGHMVLADPWPLHLDLDLAATPLHSLLGAVPWLAKSDISLPASGDASLDVPLASPRDVRYLVEVGGLGIGPGRRWLVGPFRLRGDRDIVRIEGFEAWTDQSRLSVSGALGMTSESPEPLVVRGDMALADVAWLHPESELAGHAQLSLRVGGLLAKPEVEGTLGVSDGTGRVGRWSWDDLLLLGSIRDGVLNLSAARVRTLGGEITLAGSLVVAPSAGRGRQELDVTVQGIDLAAIGPQASGESLALDATGHFSMREPTLASLQGDGRLSRILLAAGDRTMELESPVGWSLRRGRVSLDPLRLRGAQGLLTIAGQLDALQDRPTFRVGMQGACDLALLNPLLGEAGRLVGPAHLDLQIEGGGRELELAGQVTLDGGRLTLNAPAVVVDGIRGSLRATGRTLELVDWSGKVGDGRLTADGHVRLADLGSVFSLNLQAARVPLEYPEGTRTRSSGNLRLSGTAARLRLEGDVLVHDAVYTRPADDATQTLDRLASELEALDGSSSALAGVQLAVGLRLENGLRIDDGQTDIVVDGALRVGGDLLAPESTGSLSLREGGTMRLGRASLRVRGGRIELTRYPSVPAQLNVEGGTQVTGIQINGRVTGSFDDLQMSLSSPNRPDLTQGDLASLIMTGRTTAAAVSSRGAIVAEEVAASFGTALNKWLGGAVLVDLSRDESILVEDANPGQRFNLGVPLGRGFYVIYSQALDRASRRWIVDLRPGAGFRLRHITENDNSKAIEIGRRRGMNLWTRRHRRRESAQPLPRVRELHLEGVPSDERARFLSLAKMNGGDAYDYFRGADAARRISESLRKRGHRVAVVDVDERSAGDGLVDVFLRVTAGPRIDVAWAGDDPGRSARRWIENGWEPNVPIEEMATRLARRLTGRLRAMRFFQAHVVAQASLQEAATRVAFRVDRGPRGAGVDLLFTGPAVLSTETLSRALPATTSEEFFALLEDDAHSRLETSLRIPCATQGFLRPKVGRPREEIDPRTGRLRVTIPIEEGERARVAAIELPEETRQPSHASLPQTELRVGEVFRLDQYVLDRSRIAAWYRDEGYPDARVVGMLDPTPQGVVVRFVADAGPRPRVGEVRLASPTRTRRGVVESAVTLRPGDLVRPRELAHSRESLSDMGVFSSVDVRSEPVGADGRIRDVVIDLVEQDDVALEYGLRYTTQGTGQAGGGPPGIGSGGMQLAASISAVNPLGLAHRWRFNTLLGNERRLLGGSIEASTFFGRRWGTQLLLFDDEALTEQAATLAKRVRTITLQQTRRWGEDLNGRRWHDRRQMQWGYTFSRTTYRDLAKGTGLTLDGSRAGLVCSLIGDTRDSLTDPHGGLFWSLATDLALRQLGSQETFVKTYGQLFAYVPLGKRVVWAQGYRLGLVPGDNPLYLLEGRFTAGGASTVRGFDEAGLGPRTPEGVPIGGQALVVFNQELRFPIFGRVAGGAFYDAGDVFALARDVRLSGLPQSVGAGLRLILPFGPLRLDWAWAPNAGEGEKRTRWIFTLGHAF